MTSAHLIQDVLCHILESISRDPSIAPQYGRLECVSDIWRSMLFCILSSQVKVSTAAKATERVVSVVPFFDDRRALTVGEVQQASLTALSECRYRFTGSRAQYVAHSWFAFAQVQDDIYSYLDSFGCEQRARQQVASTFPGLGLKQASMFLRDIGFAENLCIIDTHLLWYCAQMGLPADGALTPRRYMEIERFLLTKSEEHGVPPRLFDSAVWVTVKTLKEKQCSMQFA